MQGPEESLPRLPPCAGHAPGSTSSGVVGLGVRAGRDLFPPPSSANIS